MIEKIKKLIIEAAYRLTLPDDVILFVSLFLYAWYAGDETGVVEQEKSLIGILLIFVLWRAACFYQHIYRLKCFGVNKSVFIPNKFWIAQNMKARHVGCPQKAISDDWKYLANVIKSSHGSTYYFCTHELLVLLLEREMRGENVEIKKSYLRDKSLKKLQKAYSKENCKNCDEKNCPFRNAKDDEKRRYFAVRVKVG